MTNQTQPDLMTLAQAGEYTNTSQRFMRRCVDDRRIPHIKLGKHVRIAKSDLDAWITESTRPARSAR